jgi:gluconokinase/shikimate kinase
LALVEKVAGWIEEQLDAGRNGVITCSALRVSYRNILNRRGHGVVFVYLAGDRATIAARLGVRHGHFMPASLLDSQFETLEEPTPDEPAIRIEIGPSAPEPVQTIVDRLNLNAWTIGEQSHGAL